MKCRICGDVSRSIGRWSVLRRLEVEYFRCPTCRFVQTEEPYWLPQAYNGAIAAVDVGAVARNLRLAEVTELVISTWFDPSARFLDFGGGYGLLVRLMRDRGFDFRWADRYAEGPFLCRGFEAGPDERGFGLVTAFEVAEHLPDPLAGFEEMLGRGRALLFSTELLPANDPAPDEWWYYVREFGQHVSIYSAESLRHIAARFGMSLASNGSSLHLLSPQPVSERSFRLLTRNRVAALINSMRRRDSLIASDFEQAVKRTARDLRR